MKLKKLCLFAVCLFPVASFGASGGSFLGSSNPYIRANAGTGTNITITNLTVSGLLTNDALSAGTIVQVGGNKTLTSGMSASVIAQTNRFDGNQFSVGGIYSISQNAFVTNLIAVDSVGGLFSTALGNGALASGNGAVGLGYLASATGWRSVALGRFTVASNASSVAIGNGARTTSDNQIVLGTGLEQVSIPGSLTVAGNQTNSGLLDLNGASALYLNYLGVNANRVAVLDGNKKVGSSSVTDSELAYLSGVTSGVQSQLDAKVPKATTLTFNGTANQLSVTPGAQDLSASRTWTLSTPQNIDTNAEVQFGNIGIGGAALGGKEQLIALHSTNNGYAVISFLTGATNRIKLSKTQDGNALVASLFNSAGDYEQDFFSVIATNSTYLPRGAVMLGPANGGNEVAAPAFVANGLGFARGVVKKNANYTIDGSEFYVGCTANNITITLPPSDAGRWGNRTYVIKDESGTAGTTAITVNGNGANIDGAATYSINANYGSVRVMFTGSQWFTY